jgi:hypothetical protein
LAGEILSAIAPDVQNSGMAFDFHSLPRPGSGPAKADLNRARPAPPDQQPRPDYEPLRVEDGDESRFSLTAVLLTLTLGCLLLAIGRWLPPALFAGATGFGLLIYGTILWIFKARAAIWHLSWWVLLAIYLFAVGLAVSSP